MILAETLGELRRRGWVEGRAVRAVHLTPYFTVVELTDGCVGAAMSYFGWPDDLRPRVPATTPEDPLLLGWLFPPAGATDPDDRTRLLRLSLGTAVLGALSVPCLRAGGDDSFVAAEAPPGDPLGGARRAVVVGFGGYMSRLAASAAVSRLHVCDLGYAGRRGQMDRVVEGFRAARPGNHISISDGTDLADRLRETDVLAVTGSALCNGTLEDVLAATPAGVRVVVQGQSASLHPAALFARGVACVATTIKPPEVAREASADPTGRRLRPHLEGGLRWVYLTPHGQSFS